MSALKTTRGQTRRIWAWYFFDWAGQPVYTVLWTFIFAPYFVISAVNMYLGRGYEEKAADVAAQALWGTAAAITGLIIAFSAPILGVIADLGGRKRLWIGFFSLAIIVGASGTWVVMPNGDNIFLGLLAFSLCFIGAEYALNFMNAYLAELDCPKNVGRHSANALAFGFAGGLVSLFVVLAFFAQNGDEVTLLKRAPAFGLDPAQAEGTRAAGFVTALWYSVFILPFFLWFGESKPLQTRPKLTFLRVSTRLKAGIFYALKNTSCKNYLISSMLYRDSLNGLYAFGGTYAVLVLDWSVAQIGVFGILAVISAAVFTWIGGYFDRYLGPKSVIVFAVLLLCAVSITLVSTSREHFFGIELGAASKIPDNVFLVMGCFIGALGGILQASSRTLMLRHSISGREREFFGFYALSGKATAFLAPSLITVVTILTQSPRLGFLPLIALFLLSALLLTRVDGEGISSRYEKSA